jgi:hypothetical protein
MEETPLSLAEGKFYHVTCLEDLEMIERDGLQPPIETGRTNFEDYIGLDKECIFFFPSIGAAQSYVFRNIQGFDKGQHRILRVTGIDQTRLYPDNESAGRLLSEQAYEYFSSGDKGELFNIFEEAGWSDSDFEAYLSFSEKDASHMRDYLATCPFEVRQKLTTHLASIGETLMFRGAIDVENIEVAALLDHEDLSDAFSELHPHLDPWKDGEYNEELEERIDEVREEWFGELLGNGGKQFPPEDYQKSLQYRYADDNYSNEEEKYYLFRSVESGELDLPKPIFLDENIELEDTPRPGVESLESLEVSHASEAGYSSPTLLP